MLSAAFSAPLSAQTLALNRVIRSLPVPQAVIRAGEQMSGSPDCERLKRWVSSVPAPAAVRGADPWLPYVEDTLFSGHFGKTYDQLTVEDFRNVQQAQGRVVGGVVYADRKHQSGRHDLAPSMQHRSRSS